MEFSGMSQGNHYIPENRKWSAGRVEKKTPRMNPDEQDGK
jgi:hypothetical protein